MPIPPPGGGSLGGGGRSSGFDLDEILGDLGGLAASAIEVPLEILSRPSYGVSEALGAGRKGGGPLDVLKAGYRGVSGGRRRYPSLGEQLFPENEAASTVADIAGDPLMFFPAARAGRAGLTFAKGTRAGKALATGARDLRLALKSSETAQKTSRLFLPLKSQLKFGGRYGTAIGLKTRRGLNTAAENTARSERSMIQATEMAKLGGEKNTPLREQIRDYIESGGAAAGLSTGNAQVDALGQFTNKTFRDARRRIINSGLFPDFKPEPNYFPHMLKQEIVDVLERGNLKEIQAMAAKHGVTPATISQFQRGPAQATENLAKMMGVTKAEAEEFWRFNTGRPMKARHIEFPRTKGIPKQLLESDPLKVVPRYMNQLNRRLAFAEEFGRDFEKLDDLLEGAMGNKTREKIKVLHEQIEAHRLAGLPTAKLEGQLANAERAAKETVLMPEIASEIRQAIRDPITPEGSIISKDFARKIMGGMTLMKMGPTSTLMNSSQSLNTIIVDGGTNFLRGVFRSRNPAARAQAVTSYHYALRENLEHLAGKPNQPLFGVKGMRWLTPESYLHGIGFTPVETVNRVLASTSGVVTAERLAREAIAAGKVVPTKELVKRGVKLQEFRYFQKFGKFSDKGNEHIGLLGANRTQHVNDYLEIPLAWRSPEARIMLQYKSFIYQQSRFVSREILSPAMKWFATDGKEGSLQPLLRASVAFNIGGQAVSQMRAFMKGDDKRKFDDKHPFAQLVRDASYVGAFGMATDIMDNAMRGGLADYVLGPSVGEAFDVASDLARFASDPEVPSAEDIGKQLYNRFGKGPLPFLPHFLDTEVDRRR